jgi:hypothetical protein
VPHFGRVASIKGRIGFSDPLGFTTVTVKVVFASRVR